MGNESCKLQKHILNLNHKSNNELVLEISTQEVIKSTGSENILCQNQDFDQCSPSSKFDINFLNSTILASHINGPKSKRDQKKTIISALKPRMGSSTRRTLIQWQQNKMTNMINQLVNCQQSNNSLGNAKLQNIRSYFEFILKRQKKESKFLNLKITGDSFFKIREQSITPYYILSKKIGEGAFGSVYEGKCLITNQMRAIKILKKKTMNQKDQKSLMSEINILKKMDHINIIKLYDVFYFNNFFYVVTEFCQGGSLLDALRSKQIFSESDVVSIMKQLISAVSYIHQMKIAHRDLKLQNVVLVKQLSKSENDRENICIKLIDFGLAEPVKFTYRNKSRLVGTIDYMAPEIFNGYFSTHSDVWSCGVILCMLLIGYNPFKMKKQSQTIQRIKSYEINYKGSQWSKVSSKAKELVSKMLVKKQEKRIAIDEIKNDEWIKYKALQNTKKLKSQFVISSINSFNRGNNFICYIKNFLISRELTQNTRQQLAMIFEKIDTDASGVLQKRELLQLYSIVNGVTHEQIEKIIDKVDQNKSGRIDFQQFLICMTDNEILRNKNYINQAFDFLDEDRTGYIQKEELVDLLEGCEEEELYKILREADFDGDNKISRQEFVQYLMNVQL